MEEMYELELTGLAYGGDALGRMADGQVVFVPFGLPGERVRVRLQSPGKRGPARADIVEILVRSPDRIEPRCLHFGVCGGCHYQHMEYQAQLKAKTEILSDQLRRIGKLEAPPIREAVPSPNEWNYRNNVQFHLTPEGKPGYFRHPAARGSAPEAVFPVIECHLPLEELNELWPQLEFEAGTGIQRLSIRGGDELMLVLESGEPEPPETEVEAGISVIHLFEEHAIVLAGDSATSITVLERSFRVSAASFFQVNHLLAPRMVEYVLGVLPAAAHTILDLYCGAGLFSAFLAKRCDKLVAVESSASACEDFTENLDDFNHVELYEGLAEDVLPLLQERFDMVLVDPPRAGLHPRVLDMLIAKKPPLLVYVSCDPSTLARDASRLVRSGYHLVEVVLFDLFPQTFHIESISVFATSPAAA